MSRTHAATAGQSNASVSSGSITALVGPSLTHAALLVALSVAASSSNV